jgi:isocitrate dehydrogenase kinase/phosphatase
VREHIISKLAVSDTASADDIANAVKASPYAHDYFVNEDYVRVIREREVDITWKLASRDVDSVLAAVCVHVLNMLSESRTCLQVSCVCAYASGTEAHCRADG